MFPKSKMIKKALDERGSVILNFKEMIASYLVLQLIKTHLNPSNSMGLTWFENASRIC